MKKTKPGTDMVKQCEQNMVNIAKSFQVTLAALDAFANVGNRYCKEHIAKKEFFEGLTIMRKALQVEMAHAVADCFMFTGVGGEVARKYAREQFEDTFLGKDRYVVMQFLNENGHLPRWYTIEEEQEFRKQLEEAYDKGEKK